MKFLSESTLKKTIERLILVLIIFLPFHTIVSVFFSYQIGIPGVNFFKEVLLLGVIGGSGLLMLTNRARAQKVKLDLLDWSILAYILILIIVTVTNGHGVKHLLFGGRYDFEFLIALLATRHTLPLLDLKVTKILHLFLLSGGVALFLGILVRIVGEGVLLYFGFSDAISNWSFSGAPPIYHGVAHASVQRFQGIFDGPNQAAYFLLVYLGVFAHVFFPKKGYDVFAGFTILVAIFYLILTYSRSAYLGLIFGAGVGIASAIYVIIRTKFHHLSSKEKWKRGSSYIIQKYRPLIVTLLLICIGVGGLFLLANYGKMEALIAREGSTYGHLERFVIGFKRFQDAPLGEGLGTAGPASRSLYEVNPKDFAFEPPSERIATYLESAAEQNEHHEFTSESYYIPESWFIQQLIEGGVLGFAAFIAIIWIIFWRLFRSYPWICAAFSGVLLMNLVLHTFESMYTSLILFVVIGSLLSTPAISDTNQQYI